MVKKVDLAFKCNFCDGGDEKGDKIFKSYCSEKNMKQNVNSRRNIFCGYSSCNCKKVIDGKSNYEDLENRIHTEFICYESALLEKWEIGAGRTKEGFKAKKFGKNIDLENRIAFLTTLQPNEKEKNRIVFGCFIVRNFNRGESFTEGKISCPKNETLKVELSLREADKTKFWDYYSCPRSPRKLWGTGLYRFLSKEQCVKILNAMYKSTNDLSKKQTIKEILNYYTSLS